MQQFTVPQFIDVEDKIIGPITTRQFVLLLAAFLLMALCYKLLSFGLFIVAAIIISIVFGTFAFAKVNGRPFHYFVENLVRTSRRPNLRVWSKEDMTMPRTLAEEEAQTIEKHIPAVKKSYKKSRLNELALMVDTKGVYKGEDFESESNIVKISYAKK